MKPQRFNGATIQKVLVKIHDALGAEALIYSTQTLANGSVEILAGLPEVITEPEIFPVMIVTEPEQTDVEKEISLESSAVTPELMLIEKLNGQLRAMDEKLKVMTGKLSQPVNNRYEDISSFNPVTTQLRKMGFRGKFCQQFASEHHAHENIEYALLNQLKTPVDEVFDTKKIITLVGPTGSGKTTTIAKLAQRYIARYGSRGVALVTTDYCDIASKNQLRYYSHLLGIPLEYANTPQELTIALHNLRDMNFILIDTYGVSQRDNDNLHELRTFLESQGNLISTYITLPCNVQEPILDEIARGFRTTNFAGCILTKQDESISMAPALSVCMYYAMPVAYFCMGQNIYRDIESGDASILMHHVIDDSITTKTNAEADFLRNMERITNKTNEAFYDRESSR